MYNTQAKTKFIELKAAGVPIYKISNELGVHRTTLIRWNKELAPYILIARQDVIDGVLFENMCLRIGRIESISRTLTMYYAMLSETQTDTKLDFDTILDRITKLTKLLLIESNAKSVESHIKQNPDDEKETGLDGEIIEPTVWVTDKEKFTRYQPDEDVLDKSDAEFDEYQKDIERRKAENDIFINSNPETIQDISEKTPEIQEVFNKTLKRKYCKNIVKVEKCDHNATMEAKDR